jgi:hypothetical protein
MKLLKFTGIVAGLSVLIVYVNNTTNQNAIATLAVIVTAAGIGLAIRA